MLDSFRKTSDKKPGKWIISFCLFFLYACQFQPDDVYFKEVEKPDFSGVGISIDSNDSIFIYEPTTFDFVIGNKTLPLKNVIVRLDSSLIPLKFFEHLSDTLSFELDPENFGDGDYTLRIEYTTAPGNSSLGDVLGYEEYLIWKELDVEINTSPPEAIEIDSIYISNGTLILDWTAPKIKNFSRYYIADNDAKFEVSKNSLSSSFSQFLAGNIILRVDIESPYFYVRGRSKSFSLNDHLLNLSLVDSNLVTVAWKKPILYSNATELTIRQQNEVVLETAAITDGTLVYPENLVFGDMLAFRCDFIFERNVYPFRDRSYTVVKQIGLGDSIPAFEDIAYSHSLDSFFLIQGGKNQNGENITAVLKMSPVFHVIDQNNLLVTNDKYVAIGASEDGQRLAVISQYHLQLTDINPHSMEVVKTTNIENLISLTTSQTTRDLNLASNNLALIRLFYRALVINEDRTKVLYDVKTDAATERIQLSPDGKYLFDTGKFFQLVGGAFQFQYNIAERKGFFKNSDKFIALSDFGTREIDLASQEAGYSFSFDQAQYIANRVGPLLNIYFDEKKDTFVYFDRGKNEVAIYDYSENRLIQKAPINRYGGYFYLNGVLIATNGRALKYN
ncbi:MAG: hypothetical protein RIG68_24540 [Imperialibacter sp.]|uniref:hypothetical protein n=1 Tax=Imperialibacter sp. TaxID=2038411 RepID=UPI0032EEC296